MCAICATAFELLTTDSLARSKELIREFLEINKLRRQKIEGAVAEVEALIAGKTAPIVFEGAREWEMNLLGTIASILSIKYAKPIFLYKILNGESQGAVRSIDGIDSVELMKKCANLLITFGGHPKASGFRLKTENLEKFKECLIDNMLAPENRH